MFKAKGFSKGSSNSSSRGLQNLANYHLKEKGRYMTAEELLKTQTQDPSSNPEEFKGLQKSDIIQFKTEAFDHWGLYIGNNCVAHLTDGVIRQSKLIDVAAGKQCRINNKIKSAARREFTALNPDKIIETVRKSLNKARENSGIKFNSEHQVTAWKYGEAFSDTLDELMRDAGRTGGAVLGGTAGVLLVGPLGLTAVPFGYEVGEKIADSLAGNIQAKTNS